MTVLFIRAMTAISATIFLVSLSWSLVTVRILEGITNLELGQASAFSMLVIALVYLAVVLAKPGHAKAQRGQPRPGRLVARRMTVGTRLRIEGVSKRFHGKGRATLPRCTT